MTDEELWKQIDEFPNYKISNFGRIIIIKNDTFKRFTDDRNYLTVSLSSKNIEKRFFVHRLVAQHFIPNSENKRTVNHMDKNRSNNHYTNLEWATHSEQILHNVKTNAPIQFGKGYGRRPVLRIDPQTDEILQEYESMTLAVKWLFDEKISKAKELSANMICGLRGKIYNNIKGKSKLSFGFKWKLREIASLENEIWKNIDIKYAGCEGYKISSLGRVMGLKGKIKNQTVNKYVYVRLHGTISQSVHRLVALHFIPNPKNKPQVNHKDRNKLNNNIDNLEWVTQSENSIHAHETKELVSQKNFLNNLL
jgi:hypothetical protein